MDIKIGCESQIIYIPVVKKIKKIKNRLYLITKKKKY